MEQVEQSRSQEFIPPEKDKGLNFTEKEIAKILMESPVYETLNSKERLELIKFLEEKYPVLAKEFNTKHIDA